MCCNFLKSCLCQQRSIGNAAHQKYGQAGNPHNLWEKLEIKIELPPESDNEILNEFSVQYRLSGLGRILILIWNLFLAILFLVKVLIQKIRNLW